jgi:hypothetical protein
MWNLTPTQHEYVFIIMLLRCHSAGTALTAPVLGKPAHMRAGSATRRTEMCRGCSRRNVTNSGYFVKNMANFSQNGTQG